MNSAAIEAAIVTKHCAKGVSKNLRLRAAADGVDPDAAVDELANGSDEEVRVAESLHHPEQLGITGHGLLWSEVPVVFEALSF